MKVKFGNKWYDVLRTKESCGITWYAIEDEPNHIDWINNPEDIVIVMDYEQKYKEALERARKVHNETKFDYEKGMMEEIFPELKESRGEKIRKALISVLKSDFENDTTIHDISVADIIDWLEKQGEQKPAEWHREDEQNLNVCLSYIPDVLLKRWLKDVIHAKYDKPINKVKPKFKKGEWLCENGPNNYARFIQILEIVNVQGKEKYRISRDIHNDEAIEELDFVEKYYHKFDIQDAQDGDVLAASDGSIFLFAGVVDCACKFYVALTAYNDVKINKEVEGGYWETSRAVHPVTKAQRDLLFAGIKGVGYKWDSDKKELIKL